MSPVLVGMPGVGKSAVARHLAEQLALRAVDCDAEIERHAGVSVAELWARGEPLFRRVERRVLRALLAMPDTVVATGGGAVLDGDLRAQLRERQTIWLRAAPAELAARLRADGVFRPLLRGDEPLVRQLVALSAQREPLYRTVATHAVDTDGLEPCAVAAVVAHWLRSQR